MDAQRMRTLLSGLVEQLAAIEHTRWAHWQRYVHDKCLPHGDQGDLLIPAELVKRWEQQIVTPYAALSEEEKESDREQVRKYLPLIIDSLTRQPE
jgi:hypothetical protein